MEANGRNVAAAVAILGYFVSYVAAASVMMVNVGLVFGVLVRGGNAGNPDSLGWFVLIIAMIVTGVPVGLSFAWYAYRNRIAHLSAVSLGVLAAILGGAFGAKSLMAANTAQSLGEGFGYTISA